jgi:hypothetical protein
VTDQLTITTIDGGYADVVNQGEGSLSTTSPKFFFVAGSPAVAKRQSTLPIQSSPVSSLRAYLGRFVTGSASALIEGGSTLTEKFFLPFDRPTGALQRKPAVSSRHEKHARLIALIESWLADASGYDEAVWPRLKARIEESRTSARKRFGD